MKQVDIRFKNNLRDILNQPWEVDNRAKWEDGSPVMTKRIFGVKNMYDVSKSFPITTLRPIAYKSAIDEVLWIWQRFSTDTSDLLTNIWKQWANEEGFIENCYGDQMSKPTYGYRTQTHYILGELIKNPTSRRLVTSMFDPVLNQYKSLLECAMMTQWNVDHQGFLNMILYQRSQDFLVANNWNVVQYAALLCMFAHHCKYKPGKLIHMIGDCHIYNKHEKEAYELLERASIYGHGETLVINYDNDGGKEFSFWDKTYKDFSFLDGYDPASMGNTQMSFDIAI